LHSFLTHCVCSPSQPLLFNASYAFVNAIVLFVDDVRRAAAERAAAAVQHARTAANVHAAAAAVSGGGGGAVPTAETSASVDDNNVDDDDDDDDGEVARYYDSVTQELLARADANNASNQVHGYLWVMSSVTRQHRTLCLLASLQ
jgi:hypothetical protein